MDITVGEIAKMLNAVVEGDPSVPITGPAKIEEGQPGMLTFLANPKYEHYVYKTMASAVLVDKNFNPTQPVEAVLVRVDNVYASVGQLLKWYESRGQNGNGTMTTTSSNNIHATAKIASDVTIGPLCIVGPNALIGPGCELIGQVYIGPGVKIGQRCKFYPGVRIQSHTEIGDDCAFYDNAVIGSDGFGYSKSEHGYEKIPQVGKVRIGNKVEIGAGSVVDRAVMGETVICDGVIIDNLVHIAHNVVIGECTAIAAQTGIAGSTKIGKNCVIGGQVGIAGHLSVADGTMIQAKSGLSKTITEPNSKLFGYPAIEYHAYLKSYAHFKRLPEMEILIKQLLDRIEKLENQEE
jgi:UDP-3-O-[3-hydroxymyristoyl] glucosamine N-acyltransferase